MLNRTLGIAGLLLMSATAFAAGTETPRVDQRQANQERRIDQGVASGALTQREAAHLEHKQDKLATHEEKAKADGKVTGRERARLRGEAQRNSNAIARKKHNGRRAPGSN